MICSFVFSPTGGTQKVMDAVAAGVSGPVITYDLCDRKTDFSSVVLSESDLCFFAVPSFGGRVPATALARISALQGNGASAVAVAVYGNRHYDDTFAELQDVLERSGFRVAAGIAAIAEHSIVHSIATGRPDDSDREELRNFGSRIQHAVMSASGAELSLRLPGNRPYKEAHGGAKPIAGADCTRCGLCAAKCPAGAIPEDNPAATDAEKCISCMRCIAVCPNRARSLPAGTVEAIAQRIGAACAERKANQLFLP